jgi:hypothetical protein
MISKQKIYEKYLELITSQVNAYQTTLNELMEAAANETKSTAGDKHETALAMLQIEQRNISVRLQEGREKKKLLERISGKIKTAVITKGSLIKTNHGYFYLTVALGKIELDGVTIIAISPQSPLGIKLEGRKRNDQLQVNGTTYIVQEVH